MRHLIIGTGAAGIAAARSIRECRSEDEIFMISQDSHVHSRCILHKYLSHERVAAELDFTPEYFMEDTEIYWKNHQRVYGIDTSRKLVQTAEDEYPYDMLLIASGAESIIPPVGDLRTASNVFGLRHLRDAQAIDRSLDECQNVVIIGSGLVGLDAAYAFLEREKNVTIVEMAPCILPLQLDEHAAAAYQELFEQAGAAFLLGKKASATRCDQSGNITHLLLESGEELPCDMVLVAAGVRPATDFLHESGIRYDRFIETDEQLQTSIPGVYAAGDVTGRSGIWPNAVMQGEIAGKNMCGQNVTYDDTFAIKNTINFYGLVTLSVGQVKPMDGDEVFTREDCSCYQKIILRDGRVRGVIIQGDISGSGFWQHLIKNNIDISKIRKPIWKLSFADFYDVKENGEYEWKS